MDPNAVLRDILDIVATYDHDSDEHDAAGELVDLVSDLNTWLTRGGYLPHHWVRSDYDLRGTAAHESDRERVRAWWSARVDLYSREDRGEKVRVSQWQASDDDAVAILAALGDINPLPPLARRFLGTPQGPSEGPHKPPQRPEITTTAESPFEVVAELLYDPETGDFIGGAER